MDLCLMDEKTRRNRETQRRFRERHKDDVEYQRKLQLARKEFNKKVSEDDDRRRKRNELSNKSRKKRYYERIEEDPEYRKILAGRAKSYRNRHPFRYICMAVKRRAKKANVPFNLTPEYLEQLPMERCPITNVVMIPFYETDERYHPNKSTLDRIVPSLGYVEGNVAWVSHRGNLLKSNHTVDTLVAVYAYITQKNS